MRGAAASIATMVLLAITVWSLPAGAGTQDNAVFALHARSHNWKADPCATIEQLYSEGFDCTDFTTNWPVNSSCDLYIVVAGADPAFGVAFASFGIRYNNNQTGAATRTDLTGVDVYDWTPCHSGYSVSYPSETSPDAFPASGSGLRVYWDPATDCQTTVPGVVGVEAVIGCLYVYPYSPDYVLITENQLAPDGPEYLAGDCNGEWSELERGGIGWDLNPYVKFSVNAVEQGNNPCFLVPVRRTSWSRLKTTYK